MMDVDEIRSRLDMKAIGLAAAWAARELADSKSAMVDLAPGDMTLYRIIVLAPQFKWVGSVTTAWSGGYIVALANCSGRTYPWMGHNHNDPGYVAEKWTEDARIWTGVVLATFLDRLAEHLQES